MRDHPPRLGRFPSSLNQSPSQFEVTKTSEHLNSSQGFFLGPCPLSTHLLWYPCRSSSEEFHSHLAWLQPCPDSHPHPHQRQAWIHLLQVVSLRRSPLDRYQAGVMALAGLPREHHLTAEPLRGRFLKQVRQLASLLAACRHRHFQATSSLVTHLSLLQLLLLSQSGPL